jgi:hypothetical protein
MRLFMFAIVFAVSSANAIELSHEEATSFLKSKGCEFGAFKVYRGKPVASILKKGSLDSRGICIATISSMGAKKFCAARAIDFNNGKYFGDINVGSTRRVNGSCSLDSMMKIYTKGSFPQLEATVNPEKWEWVISIDSHGFSDFFLKATKGK